MIEEAARHGRIAANFEEWLRRIFEAFIERDQSLEYWLESPLGDDR